MWIRIQGVFQGIRFTGNLPEFYFGQKYAYKIDDASLLRIPRETTRDLELLLNAQQSGEISIRIGRNHLSDFYRNVRPRLREVSDIEENDVEVINRYLPLEPVFMCYLDVLDMAEVHMTDRFRRLGIRKSIVLLAEKHEKSSEQVQERETSEKSAETATSLIICPASLVYNWKEELNRFAPDLSCGLAAGTKTQRRAVISGYQDYDGGSAKREACMSLVESIVEGEHKALIFSQFTTMLELLEKDLNQAGIAFYKPESVKLTC